MLISVAEERMKGQFRPSAGRHPGLRPIRRRSGRDLATASTLSGVAAVEWVVLSRKVKAKVAGHGLARRSDQGGAHGLERPSDSKVWVKDKANQDGEQGEEAGEVVKSLSQKVRKPPLHADSRGGKSTHIAALRKTAGFSVSSSWPCHPVFGGRDGWIFLDDRENSPPFPCFQAPSTVRLGLGLPL